MTTMKLVNSVLRPADGRYLCMGCHMLIGIWDFAKNELVVEMARSKYEWGPNPVRVTCRQCGSTTPITFTVAIT